MNRRALWPAPALGAIVALAACENPDFRADIVVYGDHQPAVLNDGTPLTNPFVSRSTSADPPTTAAFKVIPGLGHPRGSQTWGIAAWAKYVLLGNYDQHQSGIFQTIEDQRIGLYDSEKKTFCQLDLDPTQSTNAGIEWLAVAAPQARRSRIYYESLATSSGFSFGFVAGDLDNPSPCDTTTGWIPASRGYTPADLNAASRAAGLPDACPDNFCGFDGMALIDHNEA